MGASGALGGAFGASGALGGAFSAFGACVTLLALQVVLLVR